MRPRAWTLMVCPVCGGTKADESYIVCSGPHAGPFPTDRSHQTVVTEAVEVVDEQVLRGVCESAMYLLQDAPGAACMFDPGYVMTGLKNA